MDSPRVLSFVLAGSPIQLLGQAGEGVVEVGGLLGASGDDQRGPRLVDEDVVDLVDDREVVAALHALLERAGHVVAQVVEAELRVGAVGDVAGVLGAPECRVVALLDRRDGDAEGVVDRGHPLGVAARQVVVDRDQVDGVAGERVEEDRQRRGQGLALAGLHLRDRARVQDHAADQLHVVVALAERAAGGLAGEREGLGQQVVQRLAALGALAQGVGLRLQLLVAEQLHLGLDLVDRGDPALVLLELLALPHSKGAIEDSSGHGVSVATGASRTAKDGFAIRRGCRRPVGVSRDC